MDRYSVVGHPIKHSLSPMIHRMFAEQTGEEIEYEGIELPVTSFETRIWQLFKEGYSGFNVTAPFKGDAFDFVDDMSDRAKQARAVNTMKKMPNGRIFGDTTDGVGLLNDLLDNLGWTLNKANILILGAGGAVRGVLEPLLAQDPESLVVANRTLQKAEELAEEYPALTPSTFDELDQPFDLIINGTSASLSGQLPPIPADVVTSQSRCYDMAYGNKPTAFLEWSKQQGVKECADGLGMLVGQAAESFYIWRGVRPDVKPVIEALRQQLLD
ncbi:shikimate dehydrogenase [Reinekea thalattae]|uniref:Shikimate dehydrogenase (NADP(+)) n=1 Tax=Reinekea thalattae TaxID=2593301 RepID=A0A5C8ZAK8_9GAMM|nr:shikimate dehydrogenase [Reinekea thalattae]TXR54797.1 shikimate dehydrogenase [Reinekea thalattae]